MSILDRLFAVNGAPAKPPATGESGRDGVDIKEIEEGGPDVNPELAGTNKWEVYERMRRGDSAIRSTLMMFKLPIIAADWEIEPASDDPSDLLVAEACNAQFGLGTFDEGWLSQSWADSLMQALLHLDYGSMWEEIVWGEDLVEFTPPGGGATLKLRPIVKLGPRKPSTIMEIDQGRDGMVISILQDLDDARRIPVEKLAWYVPEREDGHWWGVSLLRSMWLPWTLKQALMRTAGIAFDRYAAGVPKIRYPETGSTADLAKANEIGRNYRTHERGWVTLPGPPPPAGDWDVEIMGGAGTIADPIPLMRFYDEQIALAAMQSFTRLGVSETGSRAVGEVLADPFYLAVQYQARYLSQQRQKLVLRRFVDVNFGVDVKVPNLLVPKIDADNTASVIDAVERLNAAGWSWNDRELQDTLRKRLGLGELPEDAPLEAEGEGLGAPGEEQPDEVLE